MCFWTMILRYENLGPELFITRRLMKKLFITENQSPQTKENQQLIRE
jgi:hypothetical protein